MKIKILGLSVLAVLAGCGETSPSNDTDTPPTPFSLAGSEWTPDNMVDQPDPPFIQFGAEGKLSGYGGCNRLMGTYTQNGDALHFGPIATTRKMCADVMETEQTILQILDDTRTAKASHLKLTLFDVDGEILVKLQRRDPD